MLRSYACKTSCGPVRRYLGSALAVFGGIVADGAMAINADTPFYMGGYGGTTYMRYESTGNNVEFYNQGARV